MDFKYGTVDPNQIDIKDTHFRISTGDLPPLLVRSIGHYGILTAPILFEKSDGYRILSGWKRIKACHQLNLKAIPVRILESFADRRDCIKLAICDNAFQRILNLVEQARAVQLLSSTYQDTNRLIEVANTVGLSINKDMLEKLLKLTVIGTKLQTGLLDNTISLSTVIALHDMNDPKASGLIGCLLMELGLGLNRQREILDWIKSICRWENISVQHLLEEDVIKQCRHNSHYDRRQKAKIIRDYLKKRRFPTIVQHENNFTQTLQKLNLPNRTQLIPPLHFESPVYSLKIDFKDPSELREKVRKIEKMSKTPDLKSLWYHQHTKNNA